MEGYKFHRHLDLNRSSRGFAEETRIRQLSPRPKKS